MRVPGSILVVFMSPIWESGVGSILMSTGLVLSSFLHPISEEGLGNSKMKKKAEWKLLPTHTLSGSFIRLSG